MLCSQKIRDQIRQMRVLSYSGFHLHFRELDGKPYKVHAEWAIFWFTQYFRWNVQRSVQMDIEDEKQDLK